MNCFACGSGWRSVEAVDLDAVVLGDVVAAGWRDCCE